MTNSRRDVIVIGGTAGSLPVLRVVAAGLPADLRAIVCVAVHVAPSRKNPVPAAFQTVKGLQISETINGERLAYGRVYIAPPDHHLLIDDSRAYVAHGPKENGRRPAIDALFRSAAVMCRGRVIAVVLDMSTEDGATGLAWIKRYGGMTIAVHQREAHAGVGQPPFGPGEVDFCVPQAEIAPLLVRLVEAGDSERATVLRSADEERS